MLTRVHGLAVWQLLRTAREGLQSEIGLRTKLAADWARAESSAGYSSAEPVPELDGGRVGALHAEGLARCSRDAAVALSLSMRTFAWQVLPLKQVAGNHKAVQAPRGRGGSSARAGTLPPRPAHPRLAHLAGPTEPVPDWVMQDQRHAYYASVRRAMLF